MTRLRLVQPESDPFAASEDQVLATVIVVDLCSEMVEALLLDGKTVVEPGRKNPAFVVPYERLREIDYLLEQASKNIHAVWDRY